MTKKTAPPLEKIKAPREPATKTDIAVLVEQDPTIVYTDPKKFDAFITQIRTELSALPVDLTTGVGRKEVASRAYKVSKAKTALEEAAKGLTEAARTTIAAVNESKKDIVQRLDELRDEIRKPLTDWEAAEEKRIEDCRKTIEWLKGAISTTIDDTAATVAERLKEVEAVDVSEAVYAEMFPAAESAKHMAVGALSATVARLAQAERDAAELAQLRADQAARDEADRHRAEAAAEEERQRLAAEEAKRLEAEAAKRAADEAAAEEAARVAREQAAADAARLAAEQAAERERAATEARHQEELAEAKRRADAAEAAAQAERDAAAQRAADQANRKRVLGEVESDIRQIVEAHGADYIEKLVEGLSIGAVRHVSIAF